MAATERAYTDLPELHLTQPTAVRNRRHLVTYYGWVYCTFGSAGVVWTRDARHPQHDGRGHPECTGYDLREFFGPTYRVRVLLPVILFGSDAGADIKRELTRHLSQSAPEWDS